MERLILRGVINDTFETSITWERFEKFHDAVKAATESAIRETTGRKGEVNLFLVNQQLYVMLALAQALPIQTHAFGRSGAQRVPLVTCHT
jgi:hypothetical protein